MSCRINVSLICGAKYHDTDFARLEILKLLNANQNLRVRVFESFNEIEAIKTSDAMITYTCDLLPSTEEVAMLKEYLHSGKRWFALHATNSVINFLEDGRVDSPKDLSGYMNLLGSQFIAHPPIQEFKVTIAEPDHPLVLGLSNFLVSDELYLSEILGDIKPLLTTTYSGKAQEGFVKEDWPDKAPRPVMYLHTAGKGEVLYLTLGHCRSKFDMQPLMDEYPALERCAWDTKEYYELLERGINWACQLPIKA